ncbi:DOMON domain-containing protein frrs1L [Boothiomyces sp. JEL0866]|nr:DOMON domain-containing protein frrs1L [Boothiomyces sp. JEL0866]
MNILSFLLFTCKIILIPVSFGAVQSSAQVPNTISVYGNADGTGNVIITVHAAAKGWVSIMNGDDMDGTQVIVGWSNNGKYMISDRKSVGTTLPVAFPTTASKIVPLQVPAPSWANLAFSFSRPLSNADIKIQSTNVYSYAYADHPVFTPTDPNTAFNIHDKHGGFGPLDFTAPKVVTPNATVPAPKTVAGPSTAILALPSGFSYSTLITVHAYLLMFAWIVCPFIGIYIARYLKTALGIWWLRLHTLFMLIGVCICSVTGILFIFLYRPGPHFGMDGNNPHKLIGIIVTGCLFAQMILGVVSDQLFKVNRTSIPWYDQAHWWLGRLTFLAALVNMYFGISLFQNNFSSDMPSYLPYVAYVLAGLGVLAMIAGHFIHGGQDNHVAPHPEPVKQNDFKPPPDFDQYPSQDRYPSQERRQDRYQSNERYNSSPRSPGGYSSPRPQERSQRTQERSRRDDRGDRYNDDRNYRR